MPSDLVSPSPRGLECAAGGFLIDPWSPGPGDFAVVTHAHSDHAAPGAGKYLCSARCAGVLRARLGDQINLTTLEYHQPVTVGNVRLSLAPAGHILGSAQVRIERIGSEGSSGAPAGEVTVVTGDYKVADDPTCDPFEPVRCHTLITESTFGLPIYRWPESAAVFADINAWWRRARERGLTCIVQAYSLGKAQRVLAGLDPSIGPIGVHGSVEKLNRAYELAGVRLPEVVVASGENAAKIRGVGIVVAPASAVNGPWVRGLARAPATGITVASASGWMRVRGARRRGGLDRGFVLSDHADWPGLHWAIRESGAQRVGVTHGSVGPMVRFLKDQGLDAFVVPTRFTGEMGEASEPSPGTAPPSESPSEPPSEEGAPA